ncbi:acyl-CoA dehydrogenase [Mycobacterium heckeshornense]|uniref:acyl-CoA dehydrogenase n=1 Tax=Mycobacterium heckeshornense TaxID=110505 RepID=UPI0019445374|nr:acyl-CoA dehydrogenase [Mycobacterium heckeshornense]BCQ07331.1 acyl-CoA dehydrogenase [Mycobacterium heckeshornense]
MSAQKALAGGVFDVSIGDDDIAELRQLVDDIGRRSFDARLGRGGLPEQFDQALWANLEDSGLTRLTSTPDLGAGPAELATVLRGLARRAGAVPLAETDLLAAWLAQRAGLTPPPGPLTVAIADAKPAGSRITGAANDVPWTRASAAVVLAARSPAGVHVAVTDAGQVKITDGHNLAGEPRDRVDFDTPVHRFRLLDASVGAELLQRGAWARCVQVIGALDAAAESSVSHTRERVQFGRALSTFQSVQHALAAMAGEIERARAAATLAVAAATDYGFGTAPTEYAVTVAKVVLGRAVARVTAIAHQLHGAIGVTAEHHLWLFTMRAQSWAGEFGGTSRQARTLGHIALGAKDPWDIIIGANLAG